MMVPRRETLWNDAWSCPDKVLPFHVVACCCMITEASVVYLVA